MTSSILELGYRRLEPSVVKSAIRIDLECDRKALDQSFERLVQDGQMGDEGEYRYRRYSRFRVDASPKSGSVQWSLMEGSSIHQDLEDNPLNGGVLRTYEPLETDLLENRLFRAILDHDILCVALIDPKLFQEPVVMGVHQVRIVARPGRVGKPTPEGIHRDAERFTMQHFWRREGITGGAFRAYNEKRELQFEVLQTEHLDSVLFEGTTWHSATPIVCSKLGQSGFRDVFLVDFDPLS